jgi:hypothetical protein
MVKNENGKSNQSDLFWAGHNWQRLVEEYGWRLSAFVKPVVEVGFDGNVTPNHTKSVPNIKTRFK